MRHKMVVSCPLPSASVLPSLSKARLLEPLAVSSFFEFLGFDVVGFVGRAGRLISNSVEIPGLRREAEATVLRDEPLLPLELNARSKPMRRLSGS